MWFEIRGEYFRGHNTFFYTNLTTKDFLINRTFQFSQIHISEPLRTGSQEVIVNEILEKYYKFQDASILALKYKRYVIM